MSWRESKLLLSNSVESSMLKLGGVANLFFLYTQLFCKRFITRPLYCWYCVGAAAASRTMIMMLTMMMLSMALAITIAIFYNHLQIALLHSIPAEILRVFTWKSYGIIFSRNLEERNYLTLWNWPVYKNVHKSEFSSIQINKGGQKSFNFDITTHCTFKHSTTLCILLRRRKTNIKCRWLIRNAKASKTTT